MNWVYDKLLYLWCAMEVWMFHAEEEYKEYQANINWVRRNGKR